MVVSGVVVVVGAVVVHRKKVQAHREKEGR